MMLARFYVPRLWWGALVAHFFYCGGMAAAIAASIRGSRGAEWVLVAQLGLGMLKGVNRATLAKAELPECEAWFQAPRVGPHSVGSVGNMVVVGYSGGLGLSFSPASKENWFIECVIAVII